LLRGQPAVVPSGLEVLTLPQHHEPCNFFVRCNYPYPFGLGRPNIYLRIFLPIDSIILTSCWEVPIFHYHIAQCCRCVSNAISLENSSLCFWHVSPGNWQTSSTGGMWPWVPPFYPGKA
jgi:hypothetical protein